MLESKHDPQKGDVPSVQEISGSSSENTNRYPVDTTQESILDLALTLVLKEIAHEARSITSAPAAAILLFRGGDPICSAFSGSTARDVSAYLSESSALPDVFSREGVPQRSDDVETDSRFDVATCRRLGIRSFLAVPIQDNEKIVVAIVQTFSPFPQAFNNRDLLALQGLGRRIVDHIKLAERTVASVHKIDEKTGSRVAREKTTRSSLAQWFSAWKLAFIHERRNLIFIVLIVCLSILLGWTLGTSDRTRGRRNSVPSIGSAVNKAPAPDAQADPNVPAVVQILNESAAADSAATRPAELKADEIQTQPDAGNHRTPKKPRHSSVSKSTTSDGSAGDVVIFENGRQIFPASLQRSEETVGVSANNNDSEATNPESGDRKNPLSISESVSEEHLLKRVEPDYPESAREQRLQGTVILNITVGSDGSVHGLSRIAGDPQLTLQAAKAVRQWKFAPLVRDGAPLGFKTQVTLNFALP